MERQFFSGNSVEQALLAASRHYGLEPGRIAYKLRDKKHGYVNVRRRVVIEVDPNAPEREESLEGSPATDHGEGLTSVVETLSTDPHRSKGSEYWLGEEVQWQDSELTDPVTAGIEYALDEVGHLVGSSFEVKSQVREETFEIDLAGDGSDGLLRDGGRALYAMEHLLPRLLRSMVGKSVFCKLDCGGFRRCRELELAEMAQQVAERAVRLSVEELLDPMNPADRRLVHLALAEDVKVRTESEGQGFMKRVRIVPVVVS